MARQRYATRGFFREELNTLAPSRLVSRPEPESRVTTYDCPDCGRKNVRTAYQVKHRYHCDICTKNTEESGGIYGF